MLLQETPQGERPVQYLSQQLIWVEQNYAMTEKEALGLLRFCVYHLWRAPFAIVTDHAPW